MRKAFLLPLLIFSLLFGAVAQASVPALIPIQGVATDTENVPLEGDYEVAFAIYVDADGQERIWEETQTVSFNDGLFTAYLGSNVAMDTWFFRDYPQVYLGVAIGGDEEMDLMTIASAPYAAYAEYAGTASDSEQLAGQGPEAYTYQAGAGLNLADNTFSINDATIEEIARSAAFDTEEEITNITNELYLPIGYLPDWANLQNIPADLLDGDDDTTYQAGSGLSLSDAGSFALSEDGCQAGFVLKRNEANDGWVCVEDDNSQNTYTGADFATSGQACDVGQVVTGIAADGTVTCAADQDSQNTYDGYDFVGSNQNCPIGQQVIGVTPDGQLNCATPPTAAASAQYCVEGKIVVGIDANGEIVCLNDQDTQNTYDGGHFALSDQSCSEGEIAIGIDSDGVLICFTLPSFASSDQSCQEGEVVTGVSEDGSVICATDQDTQNSYSGTNFATSNQNCPPGMVVHGVDEDGGLSCALDGDTDTTYNGFDFATSGQN